ncbi:MAG: dihydroorotate dehydrogenase electron transfer subunit [Oscillospiraceae bacterium]|nr:dihydroorotate dehydrogenase electron transfer subunit [Oscillospiraceae bacterium]
MKKALYTVDNQKNLAPGIFEMTLYGDCGDITRPGQFVNIALPGFYLRRPVSVCERFADSFRIIYKTVGEGTLFMSGLEKGAKLDIITGLGNGFDLKNAGPRPLLAGGGVGISPLLWLAKLLISGGARVTCCLGFNTAGDMFCVNEFIDAGAEVFVTTADGSCGTKGFPTDVMRKVTDYSRFFACGPEAMLMQVCRVSATGGQLSFEERMGCGFGACMGCSRKTVSGSKRICKDGPVFEKDEVLWQTAP